MVGDEIDDDDKLSFQQPDETITFLLNDARIANFDSHSWGFGSFLDTWTSLSRTCQAIILNFAVEEHFFVVVVTSPCSCSPSSLSSSSAIGGGPPTACGGALYIFDPLGTMLKAEDPNDSYEPTRQSFYLRFTNGPSSSSSCPFQSAYDYLHRRVRRQPRLLALDAEVDGSTAIQLFAAEMSIYENAILCQETPPEKPTAPTPGQTPANDT